MSDDGQVLGTEAVGFLLLELLELRQPRLSGAAAELLPGPTSMLVAAGLLVPHDHEVGSASLADHDDVPVSLTGWGQEGVLAYFSPAAGPVVVPNQRLVRHVVDMSVALRAFTSRLDLPRGRQPNSLIEGLLWEIGDARVGKRPVRVPIWFARRLSDPVARQQVIDVTRARPHTAQRIILTSSHPSRVRDVAIAGAAVMALRDVMATPDGLAVSVEALDARLRGVALPVRGPLVLTKDGTQLVINDGEPILFRSPQQKSAIRKLVDAYGEGRGLRAVELTHHRNLSCLFGAKKWQKLSPHLKSKNTLWAFEP